MSSRPPQPAAGTRPSATQRYAPLAALGAVGVGAVTFAVAGDSLGAVIPGCPFRLLTGLDCPFCGGTRAVRSLLSGDISGAADYNLLVPVAVFLALGLLLWWGVARAWPAVAFPTFRMPSRLVVFTSVAVITVFWVVRNLPFVPYLATAT